MALQNLVRFQRPLLGGNSDNLPMMRGLSDLHREMDRMFDSFFSSDTFPTTPADILSLDIAETDKAYVVTAELPGLDRDDVDVTVADGVLTLKGEKRQEEEASGKTFHRVERSYGSFRRVLQLPADADEQSVSATMKNGVLEIEIGKSETAEASTRHIDIKTV